MPHKPSPEFFIIGAPKCGTTTLYHWLKQHPDIFMPEAKEPHYFAQHLSDRYCRVRDESSYLNLFSSAEAHQTCGEASVLYCFYPESIKAILAFNPKAKFIFMLRHPIDMIVSYHGQLLVNLEEYQKNFTKAWMLQDKRLKGADLPASSTDAALLQYSAIGVLGEHLKAISQLVPKGQLKTILLDDMAADPKKTYKETMSFLGVQIDEFDNFSKENESSAIKSQFLEKLRRSQNPFIKIVKLFLKILKLDSAAHFINKSQRKLYQPPSDILKSLYDVFQSDIDALENHFNKKLRTKYER